MPKHDDHVEEVGPFVLHFMESGSMWLTYLGESDEIIIKFISPDTQGKLERALARGREWQANRAFEAATIYDPDSIEDALGKVGIGAESEPALAPTKGSRRPRPVPHPVIGMEPGEAGLPSINTENF